MNGEYRVKHPDLMPLYEDARALVDRGRALLARLK